MNTGFLGLRKRENLG